MIVTPQMAARARAHLARLLDTTVAVQEHREIVIATVDGLKPCDHLDVSLWGDVLASAIRRNNRHALFDLVIRGKTIIATTNVAFDYIVLAIIDHAAILERDLKPRVIVYDTAIITSAEKLQLGAAK